VKLLRRTPRSKLLGIVFKNQEPYSKGRGMPRTVRRSIFEIAQLSLFESHDMNNGNSVLGFQ
jgi:hypothetical protein